MDKRKRKPTSHVEDKTGSATSPRAGFAASPRAGFAASPRAGFAASPRAGFAASPRAGFAASPRAGFAASPSSFAPAEGEAHFDVIPGLNQHLQDVVISEVLKSKPQRSTDIFYEDDGHIFLMRNGMQYVLTPPASLVWAALDKRTTVQSILKNVAEQMGGPDMKELALFCVAFLLSAERAGLVELYPEKKSG